MAKWQHIVGILSISGILIVGLSIWADSRSTAPELELNTDATDVIDGPLVPKEQEINNPEITNDMNPLAVITTNMGKITLELFADQMPVTTSNFIRLAESGFYDGTKFHRVIDGFMIQGGDPNTKGDDESIYGQGGPAETIKDEFVTGELLTNTRGTIAMANTGQPNSGGSQFFINLVDNTNLDFDKQPLSSKHPVFGRVIEGMDVVDAIGKVKTKPGDIPVEPVVVESVLIIPRPAHPTMVDG